MKKKDRIVVALSGGVDSSVAALLLKNAGYDVIALFMRNWHDDSLTINNECPWTEDSNYALGICDQLGIPFQIIDLSKEYKERIVDYMIQEYKKGYTPNPDILCNREIKFDVFLKYAMQLNADYIATGHYCIKKIAPERHTLHRGKDRVKDQSYFLCQITQEQLKKIIFPIGHLTKKEVRQIAKKNDLITAQKKDSQGLCFVGKIKLPVFLQHQIKSRKGDIIEINANSDIYKKEVGFGNERIYSPSQGKKIGRHDGAHYFTIGQRKGLKIGGKEKPLFVISTDVKKNVIYVGMGSNHPGLFRNNLKILASSINWLKKHEEMESSEIREYQVRIRHRQSLQKARLIMKKKYLYIAFAKEQRSIAKGQFAAWYKKNELIGSGPII
ncbi:MAG: tRNA 2-thiouridine(34) synthase MnmA [Flavobacteriales bacterium]|nr:tRNA 2-thiouridine(34) synthase MnmA [Flavobacteriales bacterium]|tara:strand:- start:2607 stop:3758 length:1152 start_codon:yes stop_codon:yes gene_type:complete